MLKMTHEQWLRSSSAQRGKVAEDLVAQLPTGFAFQGLANYSLGTEHNEVALFGFSGKRFSLILPVVAEIGFDASSWQPSPDETQSWDETAQEYGLERSVTAHVGHVTLPVRTLLVPTMLVETTVAGFSWEPISIDHPVVQELTDSLKRIPESARATRFRPQPGPKTMTHVGEEVIRVHVDLDGNVTAERPPLRTHADAEIEFRRSGFRLLSSDEWEYVCGAGSRTLFRWGNHVPCDRYPTDISPAEAAWRRQWVFALGQLDYPPMGFQSDWDEHRVPNAFGLSIASSPYEYELVREPGIVRGGDGGCNICGGVGFFAGWLPLATSYYDEAFSHYDPSGQITNEFMFARRILELV